MARKSNKTAHVLNLLAGHDNQSNPDETIETTSAEAETPAEMSASESPAPADSETPAASTPQVQNISVIDTTGEDPVADLIQQKLSAQFEEPVSDVSDESDPPEASGADDAVISAEAESGIDASSVTADPPVSEPAEETADADTSVTPSALSEADSAAAPDAADSFSMEAASDNVTVPPPSPAPDPVPVSVPTPEPVSSIPIPDPESVPGPGPTTVSKAETTPVCEPEPEPDFIYVNIMESIVKDKIIYYMRQFDVCTCDRCIADTTALTLNGLTPKYIVTSPAAVDPLISFYTNKLISDVTVEATKACITVKDNPRH